MILRSRIESYPILSLFCLRSAISPMVADYRRVKDGEFFSILFILNCLSKSFWVSKLDYFMTPYIIMCTILMYVLTFYFISILNFILSLKLYKKVFKQTNKEEKSFFEWERSDFVLKKWGQKLFCKKIVKLSD